MKINRLVSIVGNAPFKTPVLSSVGGIASGITFLAGQEAIAEQKAAAEVIPFAGSGFISQAHLDNADLYAIGGAASSVVAAIFLVGAYQKTKRRLFGVGKELAR